MLHIGVMMESVQLSDIASIDILGNMSSETIEEIKDFLPPHLHGSGIEMTFHYISSSLEPATVTPRIKILPTTTYDTCRRDLDILFIGGPIPRNHPAAAEKFLKEAAKEIKLFMTVCTGSMWLASAGVLDGKKATTNREFIGLAKTMYPSVEWQDERWTIDGNVWTSGGAGAGIDMVAQYARQTFDKELVEMSLGSLEYRPEGSRGKQYAA